MIAWIFPVLLWWSVFIGLSSIRLPRVGTPNMWVSFFAAWIATAFWAILSRSPTVIGGTGQTLLCLLATAATSSAVAASLRSRFHWSFERAVIVFWILMVLLALPAVSLCERLFGEGVIAP